VFEGDRYIPSGSDAHQSLSVVLVASARIEAVKKDLKSTPFESKAIVIQPNP
jgi:hypothetical protein